MKRENIEFHPGDYICYEIKKELGKVKRTTGSSNVFAWFHTEDTAAFISKDFFRVILSYDEAEKMSEDELVSYFKQYGFSNSYAIEGIVRHNS